MRLKTFYAKSMTEAMQMVRDTLGENAIIIATREEQGGKNVRVTAAVEQEDGNGPAAPHFELSRTAPGARDTNLFRDDWLQYDEEENEEDAIAEALTDTMLRHGVSPDVMDSIITTATMLGAPDPASALKGALEHHFTFHPLPLKSPRKALMMVGAPGAGKTLATAKLAARAVMADLKPVVITTDTVRAGGVEQLEAFTKLLKTPLVRVKNPADLREKLAAARGADLILIDTGGCNPFDVDDMRRLALMNEAGTIEPVLVMPAGGDAEESAEIARCFAVLGVQRLFPTRLDIARRLGGLLSATAKAGIAFTDASNTPMVANGLLTITPQSLASLLMPTAPRTGTAKPAARKTSSSSQRQSG